MLKLKAPLIIAGATCILSMLIGLISGVRFLSILGRGLIAGIGSGGFVLCARIILERFIPDLFAPPPTASPETADISSGANINITLDDDLTAPPAAGDGIETAGTPSAAAFRSEQRSAETVPDDASQNASDSGNVYEDAGGADTSSLSFANTPRDGAGLSDLPNMGSFIDDDGDDFNENTDDSAQTGSSGFSMSGIQTSGTDSKIMAQAIRTVLATED